MKKREWICTECHKGGFLLKGKPDFPCEHCKPKECDHFWEVYETERTEYLAQGPELVHERVIKVFCQKCLEKREI